MVFGVFDGLHDGHKEFLKEAKKYGEYLIVVVAQDHIVNHLKGHEPKLNVGDRLAHLEKIDGVDEVIIGDRELSTWEVVKKYQPDVVVFGYDQDTLRENFLHWLKTYQSTSASDRYYPVMHIAASHEGNMLHSKYLNQ